MTKPALEVIDRIASSSEISTSRRRFLGRLTAASAFLATSGGVARARQDDSQVDPEVVTEFEPPSLPENLAIDDKGNVYLSMAPTGEIRQITPDGDQSTVAELDVGEEGIVTGITINADGTLHVALASGNPDTHGIWEINPEGETEQLASLPANEAFPNGIIHDPYRAGALLVTDHLGGAVWRITSDGEANRWVDHPLFDPNPYADPIERIGADGIAVHPDGDIFVNNFNFGGIVRIPVEQGGTAGTPEVYVQDDTLDGADGMTFDKEGNLYVAVYGQNQVVRITPNQETETIVSGGDLDNPSDVHFGRTEDEQTSMYLSNFAFRSFRAEGETANPSLMKFDVGARGFFPEQAEFQETQSTEGTTTDENATRGNVTEGNGTETT